MRSVAASILLLASLMPGLTACATAPAAVPPAPPAPPPSTAAAKIIYEDNFAAYNPRWRQVRGHWLFRDGQLMQVKDDAREGNALMYVETITIADADIRARFKTGSLLPEYRTAEDEELMRAKRLTAGAGVLFRLQDDQNYYMFRLAGEEGAVLGKMKDGEWIDLANPRAAEFAGGRLKEGTDYELRVKIEGDRIQCFVNNRAVANMVDTSFSTGRFGVVAFRSQAAFAAIRVTEP